MWGSQTVKTDGVLNNIIGFTIDQDPKNILHVQPREWDAKKWSKSRLAPMLRDTPCLRGKVANPKKGDSGNTLLEKYFAGSHRIIVAGANAPANLAGDSAIALVTLDEVDRWVSSAGTEGDPVGLAENRAAAASDALIVLTSTPGLKGASRIEPAFLESDQRYYFVPCLDCGGFQTLKWKQVKYKDPDGNPNPKLARYECEFCSSPWADTQKNESVAFGDWHPTAPFTGTAGFHLNQIYAPWPRVRMEKLAERWIAAQRFPERLKVFVNTALAETWEEQGRGLSANVIAERARLEPPYPTEGDTMLVPRQVAIMTCGVDVQDNRIELIVLGFGRDEECWALEYHVLPGDPTAPVVWQELWEILIRPRHMERGGVDYIRATCVDTGAHSMKAYDFCKPRHAVVTPDGGRAYVFAVKGSHGEGTIWPRSPTFNNKGKVPLYTIKVDAAKDTIYSRLGKVVEPGAAYFHFPNTFEPEFFKQLTAEHLVATTDRRGYTKYVWKKKTEGARNEALDTTGYGYAALKGLEALGLDLNRKADEIAAMPPTAAPESSPQSAKRRGPIDDVARSNWLGR